MGPMGMARSAGQVLFDLAIKDIDEVVGSRERFGVLIYESFIKKDEPTEYFFQVFNNVYPHSMVAHSEIAFIATMSRIATTLMMSNGTFNADQKDRDKG